LRYVHLSMGKEGGGGDPENGGGVMNKSVSSERRPMTNEMTSRHNQ